MLLFPRAERTRAALLAHYSDELTRCLDGIDGASRADRLAGDDPRTAVAVGAVFWLARRLDVRGTDAKPHAPSFDEIERVLTPMVRARGDGDCCGVLTDGRRRHAFIEWTNPAPSYAAKLAAVAAAARAQLSCLSSLPERPGGEFIARVYGAPAAAVVGEALDDVLDAMTRHPRGDDADGGGGATGSVKNSLKTEEEDDEDGKAAHRACVAGVRAWATVRAVADGFALVTLPAAVNDSLDANAWRPTLAIRVLNRPRRARARSRVRVETGDVRVARYDGSRSRPRRRSSNRCDGSTSRTVRRTPATTPAMKASEVWNACAGALREAAAVVSAIVASPPRDEGVVDVVRNGRNGRAGDRAAGVVATCVACLERVALRAEYALRGRALLTM